LPANRRLSGAGFALTGPVFSHHFGHECVESARYARIGAERRIYVQLRLTSVLERS
jgi:hypothetical protein